MNQADLDQLIAATLRVPIAAIADELTFSSIPAWDSLAHINLMLAIERTFTTEIDENTMLNLTSVRAIREFVAGLSVRE